MQGFVDKDEVLVMTNLDDIAKSIFSDIYGGIYW